jgi:hypothetical protein
VRSRSSIAKFPLSTEEKIIGVIVLMPREFALGLDHHDVVLVELRDGLGRPVI